MLFDSGSCFLCRLVVFVRAGFDLGFIAPQIEQPKNFVLCQAKLRGSSIVFEDFVEQCTLGFQDIMDSLFDRAGHNHSSNSDATGRSDTMSAIDRLVFDGWIPPTIKQENVSAKLEV